MGKKTSVWLIEALTNLHVGNESLVNFSVIDKSIQRDVVTTLPCINSSSLKGAVKEFVSSPGGLTEDKVINIFGSIKKKGVNITQKESQSTSSAPLASTEKKDVDITQKESQSTSSAPLASTEKKDMNITQKGSAIFFDANLLLIPKPCTGEKTSYELITCVSLLNAFFDKAKVLGYEGSVEDKIKELQAKAQEKSFNEFALLCNDDSLPIIARNCLESGESVNLWYEQVLPSKSILGAIIQTNEEDDLGILNGKVIQIGANATIGYGYCRFTKL